MEGAKDGREPLGSGGTDVSPAGSRSRNLAERFPIPTRRDGAVRILEVRGELDIATAPRLRDAWTEADRDRKDPVVIDLRRCTFVDSKGLAALISCRRSLPMGWSDAASNVALVCGEGAVSSLLELTGIDKDLLIFETVDAATTALVDQTESRIVEQNPRSDGGGLDGR